MTQREDDNGPGRNSRPIHRLLLALLIGLLLPAAAFGSASPLEFFNLVGGRLLQSELQVDLNRIEVYPTNRYTPAVHRLLQIAANLYEATVTNRCPELFRPRFGMDGDLVFISGYETIDPTNQAFLSLPLDLSNVADRERLKTNGHANVFGMPWIIGVKNGLPGFNELAVSSVFDISRRVEAVRPNTFSMPNLFRQQLILGVSQQVQVETWNPYHADFDVPTEVFADCILEGVLTNSDGVQVSNRWHLSNAVVLNSWRGTKGLLIPHANTFVLPLRTNATLLPLSLYNQSLHQFESLPTTTFEPVPLAPLKWDLTLRSRIRVVIREAESGRILDYVHFDGPDQHRDLSGEIQTSGAGFNGLWNTNLTVVSPILPQGVLNQLQISLGIYPPTADAWNLNHDRAMTSMEINAAIAAFRAFHYASSQSYNGVTIQNPTNLVWQVPLVPTFKVFLYNSWQANDPLLHHFSRQLIWTGPLAGAMRITPPYGSFDSNQNIGSLNDRYAPWGGNPSSSFTHPFSFTVAVKDPLVRSLDTFDFPEGEAFSAAMLGRIHRGTPWQTIYLKSDNILNAAAYPDGLSQWAAWTGNPDLNSARQTSPTNDWLLASRLVALLQTNDVRLLPGVNPAGSNRWLMLLDGMKVFTNSMPEQELVISSNAPQTRVVAAAIERARNAQPGGYFVELGQLLSIPELTRASPWMNPDAGPASDAALERLPIDLLSGLREDSVGMLMPMQETTIRMRFTGYDRYPYAIQQSSNLIHWTTVATNSPREGVMEIEAPFIESDAGFYRTLLLP